MLPDIIASMLPDIFASMPTIIIASMLTDIIASIVRYIIASILRYIIASIPIFLLDNGYHFLELTSSEIIYSFSGTLLGFHHDCLAYEWFFISTG